MGLFTWFVCLFMVCEQSLDYTTIPTITGENSEDSAAFLPESRTDCDLNGYWYNELGSEMYLMVASNGVIRGEYRTAIEFSYGAAGDGPSYVTGSSSAGGNLFGFNVVWKGYNSTSVTSWVGVCEVCDGQTTLTTSWMLHSTRDCDEQCTDSDPREEENRFTRAEQKSGPRRKLGTHNPRDFQEWLRNRHSED